MIKSNSSSGASDKSEKGGILPKLFSKIKPSSKSVPRESTWVNSRKPLFDLESGSVKMAAIPSVEDYCLTASTEFGDFIRSNPILIDRLSLKKKNSAVSFYNGIMKVANPFYIDFPSDLTARLQTTLFLYEMCHENGLSKKYSLESIPTDILIEGFYIYSQRISDRKSAADVFNVVLNTIVESKRQDEFINNWINDFLIYYSLSLLPFYKEESAMWNSVNLFISTTKEYVRTKNNAVLSQDAIKAAFLKSSKHLRKDDLIFFLKTCSDLLFFYIGKFRPNSVLKNLLPSDLFSANPDRLPMPRYRDEKKIVRNLYSFFNEDNEEGLKTILLSFRLYFKGSNGCEDFLFYLLNFSSNEKSTEGETASSLLRKSQSKIFRVLRIWLDLYWNDFANNHNLSLILGAYLIIFQNQDIISNEITEALIQIFRYDKSQTARRFPAALVPIANSQTETVISFENFDPAILAEQLTLVESELFYQVPVFEFLERKHKLNSPHEILSSWFNNINRKITCHLATSYLNVPAKPSLAVVKKFLKVAEIAIDSFNNFMLAAEIYFALITHAFTRLLIPSGIDLENLLEDSLIGENYASKYKRLKELFAPKNEVYKKAIEKLNGKPYIPYIPTLGKWVEFGFAGNNLFIEIEREKYSNEIMDLEVLKVFRGPLIAPAIENFRKNYYGINNFKPNVSYIVWIKNAFFGKIKKKELNSLSLELQASSLAAQSNSPKSKSTVSGRNARIFSTSSPKKARRGSTILFRSGDEKSAEQIAKQPITQINMQLVNRGRAVTASRSICPSSTPSPTPSNDLSSDFASLTVATPTDLSSSSRSSISNSSSSTSLLSTDRTSTTSLSTPHQELGYEDEDVQS